MNRRLRRQAIKELHKKRIIAVNSYNQQFKALKPILGALTEEDAKLLDSGEHPNTVFQTFYNNAKLKFSEITQIDLAILKLKNYVPQQPEVQKQDTSGDLTL